METEKMIMVSEVNGPNVGAVKALDQRGAKVDQAAATDAKPNANARGAEVVTLTDLAARIQQLTQSIADLPVADQEKIEAFRQSIADGSYEVDPGAVAEKLTAIESLLADLSRSE
jgi:negative regulator of flagellin synthesis FlgM